LVQSGAHFTRLRLFASCRIGVCWGGFFGVKIIFCRRGIEVKYETPRASIKTNSRGNLVPNLFVYIVLLYLGCLGSLAAHAENYEFGQGWRSDDLYLSGYTNLEVIDRFGTPTRLVLDDLSLFASGHLSDWVNPFAEVELSNHTLLSQGGGVTQNGDVVIERFYNDVRLSERHTLRVGKMLTPLGKWNRIHAAPLLPMVTRPYTAARGFHAYASGINWAYETGDGLVSEAQLYWQPDNEWFKRPATQTIRNFHNVIGGYLGKTFGLKDQVGVSFQQGTLIESGERYTLFGINAGKTSGKLRLESEAVTARFSDDFPKAHGTESGIFVLAEYAFASQWRGIAEAEYYRDHMVAPASRTTSLAVNYKPSHVPVVWKLEYTRQAGTPSPLSNIRTGLKAALAFFL
jgi:hypothetical protein